MDTMRMIDNLTEVQKYLMDTEMLESQLAYTKRISDVAQGAAVAADNTIHAIKGTLMDITLRPMEKMNQIADLIVSYEKAIIRMEYDTKHR